MVLRVEGLLKFVGMFLADGLLIRWYGVYVALSFEGNQGFGALTVPWLSDHD